MRELLSASVPRLRIRDANEAPVNHDGEFVLYWMTASRRTHWNFALQRAADWADELGRPLVVLEGLRAGYRWASDRLHRFVLDGMADNAARLARTAVLYYPYLEPFPGAGKGLIRTLSQQACLVVTDDFPAFFLPRMTTEAARQAVVKVEMVDSNGLLPLRAAERTFPTAYSFRRFVQTHLPAHLPDAPRPDPLKGVTLPPATALSEAILRQWPPVSREMFRDRTAATARLPIDHSVRPSPIQGGAAAASARLRAFVTSALARYEDLRNHPDEDATSGLSPYLHFGHISAHQVFHEVMIAEGWFPEKLAIKATGGRSGWWGVSSSAEGFLDQLVVWRELGYNMCRWRDDYDRYESLPEWVLKTLAAHASDPRPHRYSPEDMEAARTHDRLWNAAQTQLLREGRMHNYLRMLWGKKILEWSPSPRAALKTMIELNDRYALDGRDPNSYSGIFWVLGRYDRPWGPERPVFGKIRYMTSENTQRKVRTKRYVATYAGGPFDREER